MTPGPHSATSVTSQLVTVTSDAALYHHNVSEHSLRDAHNAAFPDGCIPVAVTDMEFLPWDNPDNVISLDVEKALRTFKINMLGLLFLIGVPANVINMVVFYKQGLKDRINLCLFCLSLVDGMYLTIVTLQNGEQLYIQFTTGERFGPFTILFTNANLFFLLSPFFYFSAALSAFIATERCLCVYCPLKFKGLLSTKTMVLIIVTVCLVTFGLFVVVSFRYRIGCFYDPVTGALVTTGTEGEFYRQHKQLINIIESFIFGVGLPGIVITVVTVTTIMTIVKLRQAAVWRSGSSSTISAREVALTKMLVGNSILFVSCTLPNAVNRFAWIFYPEINVGRRKQNVFMAGLWICQTLSYVNATFNIVVYYVMGSHYRKTFHALFSRKAGPEKT